MGSEGLVVVDEREREWKGDVSMAREMNRSDVTRMLM